MTLREQFEKECNWVDKKEQPMFMSVKYIHWLEDKVKQLQNTSSNSNYDRMWNQIKYHITQFKLLADTGFFNDNKTAESLPQKYFDLMQQIEKEVMMIDLEKIHNQRKDISYKKWLEQKLNSAVKALEIIKDNCFKKPTMSNLLLHEYASASDFCYMQALKALEQIKGKT